MIEEETSSSEQDDDNTEIKVSRVGYIEMKRTSKKVTSKVSFKAVHCVLIGGSFYWYKNAKAVDVLGSCDLRDVNIENNLRIGNKDCFVLKGGDDVELFVGHITSETSRDQWVALFSANKELEPHPPLERDEVKIKKIIL
jgi:hypothetical protein